MKRTCKLAAALMAIAIAAQVSEASPSFHFIKTKKFWTYAAPLAVPVAFIPIAATRDSHGTIQITRRRPPAVGVTLPIRFPAISLGTKGK